jgi:hypothetical protein
MIHSSVQKAPLTTTKDYTMNQYFAQPYDISATGFYFADYAEYETKAATLRNDCGQPVEEFEIQHIDGPDGQLFAACGINQGNLFGWFDDVEDLDDNEKVAMFYLLDNGVVASGDIDAAMGKRDEVTIHEGTLKDAAEALFDDIYLHEIPAHLHNYIDYAAFANDCQCGGDMNEFEFGGTTYTCTNANSI